MIAVLGASGLVGSHLLLYLAKTGQQLKAICRDISAKDEVERILSLYGENAKEILKDVVWASADITNYLSIKDALIDCSHVYHCAAMISYQTSDRDKLYQVNVLGTANVVNVCLELGIDKLCYASSTAALGSEKDGPVSEKSPWKENKVITGYANSKYNAELEVWRGIEEGLNAVMVNPCIILGPADWNSGSAALFTKVYSGLSWYPTGANAWIDVRDVAEVMIKLMDSDIHSERFVLVGENNSFKKFLELFAKHLGVKPPTRKATPLIAELAWRMASLGSIFKKGGPVLTKESARASMRTTTYDVSKVDQALQHPFRSLNQMLHEHCQLFLKDQEANA